MSPPPSAPPSPPEPPMSPIIPCSQQQLVPDAGLRITPPPVVGATLGAASILAVTEAGSASTSLLPEGLIHQASFQTPVAPAQSETGMLYARIGETVFQNAELVAAAEEANAISGILRTTHAYVDSSVVHVTFNLLDANKNLRVETSGLLVRLTLVASTGCDRLRSFWRCGSGKPLQRDVQIQQP